MAQRGLEAAQLAACQLIARPYFSTAAGPEPWDADARCDAAPLKVLCLLYDQILVILNKTLINHWLRRASNWLEGRRGLSGVFQARH